MPADSVTTRARGSRRSFFWDFEDRLVRVEKTDGTVVTHAYDADGNRVRTEVTPSTGPPEVTNFLVDPAGSLSHVVAETDGAGTFLAYYVRGDDLLSVVRPNEQRFYHADGLGSIRFLTKETGNVTDRYTYTAFGEELSHVGIDVQPYRFAAQQFDPIVEFYYNRARWLDPSNGRFVSIDLLPGLHSDPLSLHRYLYAHISPISATDPTGLFSIGELAASISIQTTLRVIANIGRRAAIGAVVGGLINAVDARLRGESALDGFKDGAIWGAAFGAASIFRVVQPLLALAGFGAASFGAYQAVQADNKPLAIYRTLLAITVAGLSVRAFLSARPPNAPPDPATNLASASRTQHILYGDGPGSGGHLWPGQPGKTPFPRSWSPARIMEAISDIATDPSLTWKPQTGSGGWYTSGGLPARFVVIGQRFGVTIRVIIEPAGEGIITAHPL